MYKRVVFIPVGTYEATEEQLDLIASEFSTPVFQTVCEDSVTGCEWFILASEPTAEEREWVLDWLQDDMGISDLSTLEYIGSVEPDYECLKYVSVDQ